MAQYIDYVGARYADSVMNELCVVGWPLIPTVYINLVCVDRITHVSKQEADECTRAMVMDGSVNVVLGKKTPIDFSDIAKDVPLVAYDCITVTYLCNCLYVPIVYWYVIYGV